MTENLAQEIREHESMAKAVIADAKAEAAKMIASAQAEAEQSIKDTRQQCHRQWRESVTNAEKEAHYYEMLQEAILSIQGGDNPSMLEQKLRAFTREDEIPAGEY